MIQKLEKGSRVGLVCCSNGQKSGWKGKLEELGRVLRKLGLEPVYSEYIFERDGVFSGTAKERAASLMEFYRDPSVKAVFDISGGDIANEILPELDFDVIGRSGKQFWGYSDLTTIINAIYTKTGKTSVLYQVRNLIYDCGERQREEFRETVLGGGDSLSRISARYIQGHFMEGTVVGGNIRCFLKLAGTPYFPDLSGKILLLEAYGGGIAQMTTYLSQLRQIGAFGQAAGVLLGTFTELDQSGDAAKLEPLVLRSAGPEIPIARTSDIGHGTDARAAVIGARMEIG